MAQYDKGRYYWIKLTDRFMTSDTVDFLMSQKDGANYVVLYQLLCLKTVNNDGIMARKLGEMIVPYDVEKIQRDCKWFSVDTVRIALELYKKLGLIYENNDGVLAISNFDRLIGSQTFGAEKKELQKSRGGTKVEKIPPDKEIKRLRERDEDIDIYKTTTTTVTPPTPSSEGNEKTPIVEVDYLAVTEYFIRNHYISSPSNFYTYNKSRGWLGIGGEDVSQNWEHYADMWELEECRKLGQDITLEELFERSLFK